MSNEHKEFLNNLIKEKIISSNGIVLKEFKSGLKSAVSTRRKIDKKALRGLKSLLKDADTLRMIDRRVLNIPSLSKGTIKNTSENTRDFNSERQIKTLINIKKSNADAEILSIKRSKDFIIQEFRKIGNSLVRGKFKNFSDNDSLFDLFDDLFDRDKKKKRPKHRPRRNRKKGLRNRIKRFFRKNIRKIQRKLQNSKRKFGKRYKRIRNTIRDSFSKKNQQFRKRIEDATKKLNEIKEKVKNSKLAKNIKNNLGNARSKIKNLFNEGLKRFNTNKADILKKIKENQKIQEIRQNNIKKKAKNLVNSTKNKISNWLENTKKASKERYNQIKAERERIRKEQERKLQESRKFTQEQERVRKAQTKNNLSNINKSSVTVAPSMNGVPTQNTQGSPQSKGNFKQKITDFIKNKIGSRVPSKFLNIILKGAGVLTAIYTSYLIYDAFIHEDYRQVCILIASAVCGLAGAVVGTFFGGFIGQFAGGVVGAQFGAWLGEALYVGFESGEGIIKVAGKIIYRDFELWSLESSKNTKVSMIQNFDQVNMMFGVEPPSEEDKAKAIKELEEKYKKDRDELLKKHMESLGDTILIIERNHKIEDLSKKYGMSIEDIMIFLRKYENKSKGITIDNVLDDIIILINDGNMTLEEAMRAYVDSNGEANLAPSAGPTENPILAPEDEVEIVENVDAPNDKRPVVFIKSVDANLDNKSNAFDIVKDLLEEYGPELGAVALADLAPYLQGLPQGGQAGNVGAEGSPNQQSYNYQPSGDLTPNTEGSVNEPRQSNASSSNGTNPPSVSAYDGLGSVVAKYEAGTNSNKGTAAVSPDTGGAAYGRNQLNASRGSVKAFLDFAKTRNAAIYNELAPLYADARNTKGQFAQKWKELANRDNQLSDLEAQYRKDHYFGLGMAQIRKNKQFEGLEERINKNTALQEMVLSISTQHGEYGGIKNILGGAGINANMSDEEIIQKAYAYREKKYGYANRYRNESKDLLNISRANKLQEQQKNQEQEQKTINPEQNKEQAPINKDINNNQNNITPNIKSDSSSNSNIVDTQVKLENPEKITQPPVIPKVENNSGINVSNKGIPNNSISPKKESREPSTSISKGNTTEPKSKNPEKTSQLPTSLPEANANGGSNINNNFSINNKYNQNFSENPIISKQFDQASIIEPSQQLDTNIPKDSNNAGGVVSLPPSVIPNSNKGGGSGISADSTQSGGGLGSTPIFSIGCEETEIIRRDVRNEIPK